MKRFLDDNWILLTISTYLLFTISYEAFGANTSVPWVSFYSIAEFSILALAIFKASQHANSVLEMILGYGFVVYQCLQIIACTYCFIKYPSDIGMFWELFNSCYYATFIWAGGFIIPIAAYYLNKSK